MSGGWSLTVVFDDPETDEQARRYREDVDLGNGLTEAGLFVGWIREHWGLQDEREFREAVDFRESRQMVTVTSSVWDDYAEILRWLIGMTSPIRVSIVRGR